jgi:spore coat protein A
MHSKWAAGLWIPGLLIAAFWSSPVPGQTLLDPATLAKYVDPVPNPLGNVISPSGVVGGVPIFDVRVSQFSQQLHRDLPPTTVWGYNNTFPGPTFEVQRGQTIQVHWINNLVDQTGQPLGHLLPYDTTIHGAHEHYPQARIVTHLHGGITTAASDGYPEHWVAPATTMPPPGQSTAAGPSGNVFTAIYPNNQRAATLWYHDHALGATRLNVYAGLAGFYMLRDAEEAALNLPSGAFEMPLVIQDRSFFDNGQLFYPAGPGDTGMGAGGHGVTSHDTTQTADAHLTGLPPDFPSPASIVPHFIGNTNLVNGVVWPYMEVEPRKYRLRLLNGANKRVYRLVLDGGDAGTIPMHQIGTEGGLLPEPVSRANIWLAPADRADVIVDFSQFDVGAELVLRNTGPDGVLAHPLLPFTPANVNTTGQVMKFKVIASTGPDTSSLPTSLPPIEQLLAANAVRTRRMTLRESTDEYGRPEFRLNNLNWIDPVTEVMQLGELEIWEFVNGTNVAHPIHLHATHFQILNRTGQPVPPPQDRGWEDTVNVHSGETVRALVRFDQFGGQFVWHCHCLEHEDHDMMRPMLIVGVVPEPATNALFLIVLVAGTCCVRRPRLK